MNSEKHKNWHGALIWHQPAMVKNLEGLAKFLTSTKPSPTKNLGFERQQVQFEGEATNVREFKKTMN